MLSPIHELNFSLFKMKKIIGAVLTLLYISLLLKPFMPYIGYQINKAYIAETLCVNRDKPQMHCDGKCYLSKQLKKANDLNTSPGQVPAPKIDLDKLPSVLLKYHSVDLSCPKIGLIYYPAYRFFVAEFYSDLPTPPPRKPVINV